MGYKSPEEKEIKEEIEKVEYPTILLTFTPNSIEVEMTQWEKINARRVERAIRAISRERNILRKAALRAARRKQKDAEDDRGTGSRTGGGEGEE